MRGTFVETYFERQVFPNAKTQKMKENICAYKSVNELAQLYHITTAQNNILILDATPNRHGKLREEDRKLLFDLRNKLGLTVH